MNLEIKSYNLKEVGYAAANKLIECNPNKPRAWYAWKLGCHDMTLGKWVKTGKVILPGKQDKQIAGAIANLEKLGYKILKPNA